MREVIPGPNCSGYDPARLPMAAAAASPSRLVSVALALLAFLDVASLAPVLDARAAALAFYDDGYYYFQIARNLARGGSFTFDGIHATNGFHPLWLLLQAPLFRLFAGDVPPLRAVLVLEAVLAAAATVTVFRVLHPRVGRGPAAATALFLLAQPGAVRMLRGGMESALVLCLFTAVWALWLGVRDEQGAPLRRWWALGLACALFFLARLEAAVAAPILAALALPRLRQDRRRAVALLLPVTLTALAYLAWTRAFFGTFGPVSALAKVHLGGEAWSRQPLGQRLTALFYVPSGFEPHLRRLLETLGVTPAAAPLIGTLVPLAVLLFALWQRDRLLLRRAGTGVSFVVATAAAMMLLDKLGVRLMVDWYRAPSLLALALLAGLLLVDRPRLTSVAVAALAAVCVARVPQPLLDARLRPTATPLGLQAADWLRPRLAAGAVAGSWNAGLIGYFAGGRVINLDGLVNDATFLREVVRGGDLPGYLRRERVRFLVEVATPDGRPAPLVRRYPRAVAAAVEAQYRSAAAFDPACPPESAPCPPLMIWERTAFQ
jgi:hypothetical protein